MSRRAHAFQKARVIAPSEAEETSAAYLAKTPLVYRGAGAFQPSSLPCELGVGQGDVEAPGP